MSLVSDTARFIRAGRFAASSYGRLYQATEDLTVSSFLTLSARKQAAVSSQCGLLPKFDHAFLQYVQASLMCAVKDLFYCPRCDVALYIDNIFRAVNHWT